MNNLTSRILSKAFLAYLCIILISGCTQPTKPSFYSFSLTPEGEFIPDEQTSQFVKPIGSLTVDSYKNLRDPEPNWSRVIIRNRNVTGNRTDSIYDLNISDQFRFDVEGGFTSFEKPSNTATYIIDVTDSGKRSIAFHPRPATKEELKTIVAVGGGITLAAIILYLLFL